MCVNCVVGGVGCLFVGGFVGDEVFGGIDCDVEFV